MHNLLSTTDYGNAKCIAQAQSLGIKGTCRQSGSKSGFLFLTSFFSAKNLMTKINPVLIQGVLPARQVMVPSSTSTQTPLHYDSQACQLGRSARILAWLRCVKQSLTTTCFSLTVCPSCACCSTQVEAELAQLGRM